MATSITSSQKSVWGFSPQSIPGLALWLDAADFSSFQFSSGTTISSWRDKSGNGFNTITASTTSSPASANANMNPATYTTTPYTGALFSPTQQIAAPVPAGTFSTALSVFVVFNYTGTYTSGVLSIINRSSNAVTGPFSPAQINATQISRAIGGATGTSFASATGMTFTCNTPTIYYINVASNANTTWNEGNNGTITTYSTAAGSSGTGAQYGDVVNYINIGGRWDTAVNFTGIISEVICYNNTLTTTQRQQVEGYLAAKWGLGMNLPTTHPYSSVIPILPTQIPGCTLWLDGADRSSMTFSSGSSVSSWNDKSGNGNTATSAGSANPILTQNLINGVQGISLPNAGATPNPTYFFDGPISLTGTSITYFVVCVPSSTTVTAGSPRILSLGATSAVDYTSALYLVALYQYTTGFGAYRNNIGGTPISVVANTPYIFSGVATSGNVGMYTNGGTVTNITVGGTGNFSISRFRIGNEFNPQTNIFNGNIGEIIVFNTALSTTQRQQIESYLGRKWGIGVTNTAVAPGRYLIPTNRPFYPTDIPGCSLWLDGADRSSMVFSGTTVTTWRDKSGNGGATAAYVGTPTLSNINNVPAVFFNSSSYFYGPTTNTNRTLTCYVVATMASSTPNNAGLFTVGRSGYDDFRDSGSFPLFVRYPDLSSVYSTHGGSSGGNPYYNSTIVNTGFNVPFVIGEMVDGTNVIMYLNGNTMGSVNNPQTDNFAYTTYVVGARYSAAGPGPTSALWNGLIGEIILFNTSLATQQRQQVEQYLAWKWGLVANLPPATSHLGKLLPAFSTNFTVKSISGCALWLDGADRTSMVFSPGTSNVTTWRDKSGNGLNATQRSGKDAGVYSSTSNCINFTTATTAYDTSYPANPTSETMFVVANNPSPNGSNNTVIGGPRGSRSLSFGYSGLSPAATGRHGYINTREVWLASTPASSYTSGQTAIVSGNVSGGSTFISTQGSNMSSGVTITIPFSNVNTVIGIDSTDDRIYFTGSVMEIIFYNNTVLSTSQRQQVEGHLAWKWGLQSNLPSTHAYAKFAP